MMLVEQTKERNAKREKMSLLKISDDDSVLNTKLSNSETHNSPTAKLHKEGPNKTK